MSEHYLCSSLWRTLFYSFKGIRHSCGERDVHKCLAVDCYSIIARERCHVFGLKTKATIECTATQPIHTDNRSLYSLVLLAQSLFFSCCDCSNPKHKYQQLDFLHPFIQSVNLFHFFFIFIFHRNKRLSIVCVHAVRARFFNKIVRKFMIVHSLYNSTVESD